MRCPVRGCAFRSPRAMARAGIIWERKENEREENASVLTNPMLNIVVRFEYISDESCGRVPLPANLFQGPDCRIRCLESKRWYVVRRGRRRSKPSGEPYGETLRPMNRGWTNPWRAPGRPATKGVSSRSLDRVSGSNLSGDRTGGRPRPFPFSFGNPNQGQHQRANDG